MGIQSKVVYADLDAYFADTLGGAGNGKGDRLAVGMGTSSWSYQRRMAIRLTRPAEYASIPNEDAITAFDVFVRASSELSGIGGAVKFYWERATTVFTENNENRRDYVTTSGSASSEWPGPTRDTANRGEYIGAPANGEWCKAAMLAMGKYWYNHPELTTLSLVGVASDGAGGYAEGTTARRMAAWSSESTSIPYAELKWSDNQAPNIATDLLPADGSKVASTVGTEATISARHTDPEGDPASKYQAQWYPSSATDATPGTPTKDNTVTATTAHNAVRAHTFTGLPARTAGKWRIRFFDGQWAPWSLLLGATTAYKPTAVNLAVEPGTLTPKLYASISSQDAGDYISAVEELEYQDPAAGSTITKLASGKQTIGGSPTRSEYVYNGSALVFGTQYRRQMRLWNRDDIAADLTANQLFTQSEPTGAIIKIGSSGGPLFDPTTKIDTLTPTLYVSDPTAANIDQARLRIYNEAGALVYDSGTVSFSTAASHGFAIPSGVLSWGMNPKVDAADRVTGNANLGPYSEQKQGHVNAQPGSPYPLSAYHGSAQFVLRADGVYVVDTDQPIIVLPYRDTDRDLGYTDNPTRREIELRNLADAHVGASPYVITSGITNEWTIPAAILAAETTYKTRGRFDDSANVRSDWSDYLYVKRSAKPTLSSVTPADTATVTDPTPTVAWTYASSGSKAQAGYQLVAKLGQTVLYDSGFVIGTDASVIIPAFLLPNSSSIDWTLTVYDTDGLYATIARTFTTSFSQPAALTGLIVTPDLDTKSLIVSWTQSALSDAEFEAYYVYAKTEGGQFRLVTTITDKTGTAMYYRAAAHNRETIIRVSQTNGWMESDPAEASNMLGAQPGEDGFLSGYWLVRPDAVTELKYAKHGPGEPPTQLEVITALGREDKIVLNWGTTGYEGTIALWTNDRDLLELLRTYKRDGIVAILKTGYGAVRYARFTKVPDTDQPAGYLNASVDYIEVSPASAGF